MKLENMLVKLIEGNYEMKLYEIVGEYNNIFNTIDENGELTEEASNKLSLLEGDVENKAIAIAAYLKNLMAESDAIEKARKAMQEREHRINTRIEYLTEYLKTNLERIQVEEITSSPYFVIKVKKCPYSVHIENENDIPEEYKYVKEAICINKNKIKDAICIEGKEVTGASLVQNTRLEIK